MGTLIEPTLHTQIVYMEVLIKRLKHQFEMGKLMGQVSIETRIELEIVERIITNLKSLNTTPNATNPDRRD